MLEVREINSFYGRAQVLFDLSLTAAPGEAVALLGRNGAGKTTTLRSILGLLRPAGGHVRFDGRDLTGLAVHAVVRAGLGYVPEDRRIFADLTVAENLEVGRRPAIPGLDPWTVRRVQALFPKLEELMARPAGRLSGGEQQMVAVARTLMGNPRLLLLDEPSEGLAPIIVDQMAQALAEVKGQGVGILLSEQNLTFARRLSDRAYVLEKGRIRYEGTMAALAADETARTAWLGL